MEMMEAENNLTEQTPFEKYLRKIFGKDGWATKLMTPIGRVRIADGETAEGFRRYLGRVATGETFRAADLLLDARYGVSRIKEIRSICKNGCKIFLLEGIVADARLRTLLNTFTIRGLCSMLTVCGGADLEIPVSPNAEDLVHSRFVFLREKDADAIRNAASQFGNARLTMLGSVNGQGTLRVREGGKTKAFRFEELFPQSVVALQLGDDCTENYKQGRDAALASFCCSGMTWDRTIRVAEELALPNFTAAVFGLYNVWTSFKNSASVLHFGSGTQVGFVVPRPQAYDGDVLYAFCPKADQNGVPFYDQVLRLRDFLTDQKEKATIKSVLPLKKNAMSMIERICGAELEYVPEAELPFGKFTVLAIAPRGTELPGTVMGRFQSR
ncbi:MAG: hypothetical protein KBS45_06680 [Clostridiales bacterium]|nr:hypothetical protein [Candidatus Coliplasma caballi]